MITKCTSSDQHNKLRPTLSRRVMAADPAHIEAVISRFADLKPPPANLAQGVAYWDPPPAAVALAGGERDEANDPDDRVEHLASSANHKYSQALGLPTLRDALTKKLEQENGLDMTDQEVLITAGANQAFAMVALALLDPGDRALLVGPFYCAHQCAVQLAGGLSVQCSWDPQTFLPDMALIEEEMKEGVKMVVITTPGNPTGVVCSQSTVGKLVNLCKENGCWLVVDQAYEHFLYDGATHYSPCGHRLGYADGIVHLFTMSKSFGMAGWRVGYAVYPSRASESMIKIQDTFPTHACTASQRIALAALTGEGRGCDWARIKVKTLEKSREAMWDAVKDMGGVKGEGAFYFLVPTPIEEDRAIDILARDYGVLVTPGRAFGAPGHVRVSYGSLPEETCLPAIERLGQGMKHLRGLSQYTDTTK